MKLVYALLPPPPPPSAVSQDGLEWPDAGLARPMLWGGEDSRSKQGGKGGGSSRKKHVSGPCQERHAF